ncbi:MAG: sensor histidine kinase [Pseudanabaenaceae cyanobacterium]
MVPSLDLTALAQAQLQLLAETLGVVSGAVYVAESMGESPQFTELASYPQSDNGLRLLPPGDGWSGLVRSGRAAVPLLYNRELVGLLVAGREDRDWTDRERQQLQYAAETLALACALERRCQWLEVTQAATLRREQEFLATLFHQLRNPLTAIRTFAQLLRRRLRPEDANTSLVTGILQETTHLQELLVQGEQPRLLPTPETRSLLPAAMDCPPVEATALVTPLLEHVQARAQTLGLTLEVSGLEVPMTVQANPQALREVLENLMDNACKYTPAGGTIGLHLRTTATHGEITVTDTGVGIPAEDLPRLFERRFRGRQAQSNIAGTGLGLAIAHDLVQQMGGTLTVESTVGQGSRFTVSLPLAPHPRLPA